MIEETLLRAASFSPKVESEPYHWIGHVPFAAWVMKILSPKVFVELGTHTGNSYFTFCQSVAEGALLTQCYAIDTWNGDVHVGSYDNSIFEEVNKFNNEHYASFSKLLRMTFDDAIAYFPDGAIDLLHIDGLHTYEAVSHDFKTWLPKLAPGAVVLFHDTNIRDKNFGVWRLWKELINIYPNNLEFMHSCGLGVLQLSGPNQQHWLSHNYIHRKNFISYFTSLGNARFQHGELKLALTAKENQANQKKIESELIINELHAIANSYCNSTSWRITKPLRQLSRLTRRFVRLMDLYQNYRQNNAGVRGIYRLIQTCFRMLRADGIKGLYNSVVLYQYRLATTCQNQLFNKPIILSDELPNELACLPNDIAVHAHIFHVDLAAEIKSYLEEMPTQFHLYVTTDTDDKASLIKKTFSEMNNVGSLEVIISENRGRDIYPMLVVLGERLVKHELILHIHSKKSLHESLMLCGWRRYMLEALLGNRQRISALLHQFNQDESLGILYPEPYHVIKPRILRPNTVNNNNIIKLLNKAGLRKISVAGIDRYNFPAGSMFWFRGKAIQSFIEMKLDVQDFEPEEGQVDGTIAHAIERMFPYFSAQKGLVTKAYLPEAFLSPQCSAHKLDLFYHYHKKGLFDNPILLIDHHVGGGANVYSRELIKASLKTNVGVLRVYNSLNVWFVQWYGVNNGMLFYTKNIEELFAALSISNSTNLIINSLYGCPDITDVTVNILRIKQVLNIPLEIKWHDFHAICPSLHLYDYNKKYCGVPLDRSICKSCLKHNKDWFPSWCSKNNLPLEISDWRSPFAKLLKAADTVTFFDNSSIEIARRAFHLEEKKIKIVPHEINYFKCNKPTNLNGPLHIGLLGTLTHIKGGEVVLAVSEYIKTNNLKIKITVIGKALIKLPAHIKICGEYEHEQLPEIIERNRVNVIFISSVVPETFSYTVSEAMKLGLPIIAFDLGAQGNRVKQYKWGKVVPEGASPHAILMAAQSILKLTRDSIK